MDGEAGAAEPLEVLRADLVVLAVALALDDEAAAVGGQGRHIGAEVARAAHHLDLRAAVPGAEFRGGGLELVRCEGLVVDALGHGQR